MQAFAVLVGCQLAGEAVARVLGLPVPGPVLGMLLLASVLGARRGAPPAMLRASALLMKYLPLLFVPAGVGVIAQLDLLRAEALPIIGALLGSTVATMLVTGWVMRRLAPQEIAKVEHGPGA